MFVLKGQCQGTAHVQVARIGCLAKITFATEEKCPF